VNHSAYLSLWSSTGLDSWGIIKVVIKVRLEEGVELSSQIIEIQRCTPRPVSCLFNPAIWPARQHEMARCRYGAVFLYD
tara:strand:+ start:9832 stop:10068 length:237 start_codon:yes stop_codon:yes gene_type:complete